MTKPNQNGNDAGRKDTPKGEVRTGVGRTYLQGTGDFAIGIGSHEPVAAAEVPPHLRDMSRGGRQS